MTISLLIPIYKGSQTLEATLQSVLDQSLFPDEVIIGDDTSPSDKQEVQTIKKIVKRFQKKTSYPVLFIKNKINLGCQGNFQKLTDSATKDIVFYLAHDDILSTDAIAIVKNVFQKNPTVGFLTRPYFWFYDDINKPIRHVPPPSLEAHTIIPSVTELIKKNNDREMQKAIHAIFGSIGQISGLGLRREWIKELFHKDIFPGHMYPIADMWKSHRGIFIKEYILALGTATSQSRTLSGIYDDSPTEQWMRMFRYTFEKRTYRKILYECTKHIATNYLGLIQIKNFSSLRNVFKEIMILLKYRFENILEINFWLYVALSLLIPRKILSFGTDWYKNTILSRTIPCIAFVRADHVLPPSHKVNYDSCARAYKQKIESFAKNIKDKMELDFGCGFGNYTSLFTHSKNSVIGLDIHDIRSKQNRDFKIKLYDGYTIPFKANTFDVVVSFDVIEHIEHDVHSIKEMYRVLKPGGVIFIATPNRHRLASLIKTVIGKKDVFPKVMQYDGIGGKSIHITEYTTQELSKLLKAAGFTNVQPSPIWLGLRGRINFGFNQNIIPFLNHSLFILASK